MRAMSTAFDAMAGLVPMKRLRSGGSSDDCNNNDGTGGGHGLGSLTGMDIVHHVFHFIHGPADVLRASLASRRWRELACADVVWRAKAVREGMVEKARMFEVALPGAGAADADGSNFGNGTSSSGDAAITTAEEDELAGVWLSFYAQTYALKVLSAQLVATIVQLALTLRLLLL